MSDVLGYKELMYFDFIAKTRPPAQAESQEKVIVQSLLPRSLLHVITYSSLTLWVCK